MASNLLRQEWSFGGASLVENLARVKGALQRRDDACSLAFGGYLQCPRGAKINQQVFLAGLQGGFQFA